MKIKKNFVLQQVAGQYVIVPVAEESISFNGMLTVNESGALLWKRLTEGCDRGALIAALTDEYEVSGEQAAKDTDLFLERIRKAGCLEPETN